MKLRIVYVLAPLLVLAACGGGGGGMPPPTPANRAPSFTSAAAANVAENTTAAYVATATDPDNDPLTFSITGGADAAHFAITAAGALSFVTAPSFETPRDADGNNVYLVQLTVSDGNLGATLNLALTVTDTREGIAVRRIATGFNRPVSIAPVRGSANIYVAERGGNIYRLDPASGTRTLALTVTDLSTSGEDGLFSIATRNRTGILTTTPPGSEEIFVFHVDAGGFPAVYQHYLPGGRQQVLRITPRPSDRHPGGWIGFASDRYNLYVLTGDTRGSAGSSAQDTYSRFGKMLRSNGASSSWNPADQNPFKGPTGPGGIPLGDGGHPDVFLLGLRNPHRASFGPDDRLYIGDVGETIQEIDVVRPNQPGLNFGWPFLQGTQPYQGTAPAGLTAPVTQYESGTGHAQGGMVIGGYVYRGPIGSLVGSYVFGDGISGNIWTVPSALLVQGSVLPSSSYERRNPDFAPDTGTINSLISFGEDDAGNLYIVDLDGDIFMVVPQ